MTSVRISTSSGRVIVKAESRDDVDVRGTRNITVDGDQTTVNGGLESLTVRVPIGCDVRVGTNSGRIKIEGLVGNLAVVTEAGKVEVDAAEAVDIRSKSGRVTVDRAKGQCRVRTVSGRVEVGACAGAEVSTRSGRISLAGVEGPARAHCVSGRIDLEMANAADVDAATVTGRIRVSLPRGVTAGLDCAINSNSISGAVEVTNR
ncbi:MAG: DUF4097 family beta strand repeat protein [Actinomycetia bacterium]|nr:DUF4097 family beta strand repeat protein [Actinomycetes bacterium]